MLNGTRFDDAVAHVVREPGVIGTAEPMLFTGKTILLSRNKFTVRCNDHVGAIDIDGVFHAIHDPLTPKTVAFAIKSNITNDASGLGVGLALADIRSPPESVKNR